MVKIDKKIVHQEVTEPTPVESTPEPPQARASSEGTTSVVTLEPNDIMHEGIRRPEVLMGTTYKVKTPLSEHSMYVTINDFELNGKRHPFEIFVNSKSMEHFQWMVALTRIISAIFRKGGDITFLVNELRSVFDPKGGYIKKGGRYVPSLVSEIGDVIETHLVDIGLLELPKKVSNPKVVTPIDSPTTGYPSSATVCKKCLTKAVVLMDGCQTCLSCGESKCG